MDLYWKATLKRLVENAGEEVEYRLSTRGLFHERDELRALMAKLKALIERE